MRYFLLFLLCVGSSAVFCASDEQSKKMAQVQRLIETAVLGSKVDPTIAKHLEEDAYKFNVGTQPTTKIAVKLQNSWIYGELRELLGSSAAVKITRFGGSVYTFDELRNLAPNEK